MVDVFLKKENMKIILAILSHVIKVVMNAQEVAIKNVHLAKVI